MSATGKPEQVRLGFLTAVEIPEQGYVGGLLVTNRHGRPLEFQCTAPLKPNRAQEILYGATLEPYVIGEVIARTLVEKVGVKPQLILTERIEILELRPHINTPIGCLDESSTSTQPEQTLQLGRQRIRIHEAHLQDRSAWEEHSEIVPKDADLREPFIRVREALLETAKTGGTR